VVDTCLIVAVPKGASASPRNSDFPRVSGLVADAGFGRTKRLLNAGDYARVFDKPDAKASHKHLLLLARFNQQSQSRLGLVIAKKHVKTAVQRNRIKRLSREFFRTLPESDMSLDVVLLARPGIGQLDNAELSSILRQQWQKLTRHASNTQAETERDA